MTTFTRRKALATMGVSLLPMPRLRPVPHTQSWQEWAADIARMELHANQHNQPEAWERLHYRDAVAFNREVTLCYGVGSAIEVEADLERTLAWLAAKRIEVLGSAISEGRAWSVLAWATKDVFA